ncbi:MAG: putative metal-binding motif-containing protein [bacterium]
MKRVFALAALGAALMVGCVDEGSPGGGRDAAIDDDMGPGRPDDGLDPDTGGCVPAAETCDGVDNDCDGSSDEGFALGEACTLEMGGCTSEGTWVCADGGARCDAPAPTPADELCDGVDNDCDGNADEGFDTATDPAHCGGCEQACDLQNADNACADSSCIIASCLDGFADTDGDAANGCECVIGGEETCDGTDEDCDGAIDEGLGVGDACTAGVGGCAAAGVTACAADGSVACDAVPGAPAAEICNDIDDDCDGTSDEGFDADGDGFPACGIDCDAPCPAGIDCDALCPVQDCAPDDPAVNPGAREVCEDGVDQNCDGRDIGCVVPAGRIDTISIAPQNGAGCRDLNGDGRADNAFGNAVLTGVVNPPLQQSVDDRDLNLLPIAPGLEPPGTDGVFDFAVLFGRPDQDNPAAIRVSPDALDANGVPVMLFAGTRIAGGALSAGPGTFLLTISSGGEEAELRIQQTVVTGQMGVAAAGVTIRNGWVTGYVTEQDFQAAIVIVPEEFRGLVALFIQPDIDTDGNGRNDAYSACVQFTAAPATIVGYP